MHVLTRQVNEGVVIGEEIHVTVLEVGSNFVRLAVSSTGDESDYEEHVLAGPSVDVLDGFAMRRRMQMQF
jgi:hypothetical protein